MDNLEALHAMETKGTEKMKHARAKMDRLNRAWYEEHDERIAKLAGLTVSEFRNKAESVRAEIMANPEKYNDETRQFRSGASEGKNQ